MTASNFIVCLENPKHTTSNSFGPPKTKKKQDIRSTKSKIITHSPKKITIILQVDEITNKLFTNQTGCFWNRSSKGNQYVMISYVFKANTILSRPLKYCTDSTLLATYQ